MSKTITIRLPKKLDEWLEKEARKSGCAKEQVVRKGLDEWRTRTTPASLSETGWEH